MTSAASAVVVVEYLGPARTVEREDPRLRSTVHTFRVDEIIKLHQELPVVGNTFELELPGGEGEYEGRIHRIREAGMAEWQTGTKYVLFLDWSLRIDTFLLPWGPSAAYALVGDSVHSLNTRHRTPHEGERAETFLRQVRSGK